MFKSFRQWQQRGRAIRELTRLSDHELADLGMARRDIVRVVNAGSGNTAAASVHGRNDLTRAFASPGLSRA